MVDIAYGKSDNVTTLVRVGDKDLIFILQCDNRFSYTHNTRVYTWFRFKGNMMQCEKIIDGIKHRI